MYDEETENNRHLGPGTEQWPGSVRPTVPENTIEILQILAIDYRLKNTDCCAYKREMTNYGR